jgi:hypothetical protein
MANQNKYGVHDEHREAVAWNIGDPLPAWVGDPDILSLRTRGGFTVAHYLAYQGYEFPSGDVLDWCVSDQDRRTVADEYVRGVADRVNSESEALDNPMVKDTVGTASEKLAALKTALGDLDFEYPEDTTVVIHNGQRVKITHLYAQVNDNG